MEEKSKEELLEEIDRLKDKVFELQFKLTPLQMLMDAIPRGDEQTEIFLKRNHLCSNCLFWKKRVRHMEQDRNENWKCKSCGCEVPKGVRVNKILEKMR